MDDQLKILKKINRRTRFTQFLAWMALFFTSIGIAVGSKHWFRIDDKVKNSQKHIKEIQQELPNYALQERLAILEKELNDNFKENKAHLDKAMVELRTIQDSTQYIADSVYVQAEKLIKQQPKVQIQTPTLKDWTLGEVHFLLQTAAQQFQLKKDKEGAIISLKLADNLLLERGDLELLPVRKLISEDIAIINQHAVADVSKLSQKIDDLLKQLKPEIKIAATTSENIKLIPADENANSTRPKSSKNLVSRVKKTINDAVIIRKFEKPLQEDLDSDSKERLYQLFSLRFETLKIMLLQGDDNNYHSQIERIKPLITKYYSEEKSSAYLKQLEELNQANLAPELPDANDSLRLLEKIMSEKNIIGKADNPTAKKPVSKKQEIN